MNFLLHECWAVVALPACVAIRRVKVTHSCCCANASTSEQPAGDGRMTAFQDQGQYEGRQLPLEPGEMLALVERLRRHEARAATLSEKRRDRFAERSQLTPRERLVRLLDPGCLASRFVQLANFLVEDPNRDTSVPAAASSAASGS
jgi:hypothetical protein